MARRGVKLAVEGADKLLKDLQNVPDIALSEINTANENTANLIINSAQSIAKKVSGRLANSIKVLHKEQAKLKGVFQVGYDSADFKNVMGAKGREGEGFDYSFMHEYGYTTKAGKQVKGRAPLRKGLTKSKKAHLSNTEKAINDAMKKAGL